MTKRRGKPGVRRSPDSWKVAIRPPDRRSVMCVMHSIDELVPLLGSPFDEKAIEAMFRVRGEELLTEFQPGHPEDQRRFYLLRPFGLQMLIDDAGLVDTLFFMIEGDDNVEPYAWSFRDRVNGSSKRADVLAVLGKPDRSGPDDSDNPFAPGGWDRFVTDFGLQRT
jgi:hypothetical protein